MRICHVVEAGGGVGNVVIDLARAGLASGDDVTVIYAPHRAWPHFVESLTQLKGLKLLSCPMLREVGLHDAGACVALNKALCAAGPFDVIHAHSSKAGALTRILRFFFPKSVVVYTPHAFMTMAPDASPLYGWIERFLSIFCDAIICVSQQEKRHALKLGIPTSKLHVIPNGIDLKVQSNARDARARLKFGTEDYVVGFVGRLVPQKNPLRLIEAFVEVAAASPAFKLAIVGQGPLQNQIEELIKKYDLGVRVHFINDMNGRSLMPGFDCLLCSSDYESFGLVIVEALAAGLAVVTTPVGIAEEAVIRDKTGTVISDFKSQSLAAEVIKLSRLSPEERQGITNAAKKQAETYSIAHMSDKTRALYRELLRQKKAGTS